METITLLANVVLSIWNLYKIMKAYAESLRGTNCVTRTYKKSRSYKTYKKVVLTCALAMIGTVYYAFNNGLSALWNITPTVLVCCLSLYLMYKQETDSQKYADINDINRGARKVTDAIVQPVKNVMSKTSEVNDYSEFLHYAELYGLDTSLNTVPELAELVIRYTPSTILNKYPNTLSPIDKALCVMKEACDA